MYNKGLSTIVKVIGDTHNSNTKWACETTCLSSWSNQHSEKETQQLQARWLGSILPSLTPS